MTGNNIQIMHKLHSDELFEMFGPIHIQVISKSNNIRVAKLYDQTEGVRTLAITIFSEHMSSEKLKEIHQTVNDGFPIGQTIRKFNAQAGKKVICNFIVGTTGIFSESGDLSAGQLFDLYYLENGIFEYYATICEIYCPEFASLKTKDDRADDEIEKKLFDIFYNGGIVAKIVTLKH